MIILKKESILSFENFGFWGIQLSSSAQIFRKGFQLSSEKFFPSSARSAQQKIIHSSAQLSYFFQNLQLWTRVLTQKVNPTSSETFAMSLCRSKSRIVYCSASSFSSLFFKISASTFSSSASSISVFVFVPISFNIFRASFFRPREYKNKGDSG
jgi:hypothetical protein